jgi:hypothetical protein
VVYLEAEAVEVAAELHLEHKFKSLEKHQK